jgi:hypothetical protein
MSREIRLPAGTEYLGLNEIPALIAWAICPYDTTDNDVLADFQYRITKNECKKIMVDALVSGELVATHPVAPTPAREFFTDGVRHDDELLNEFFDLCRISTARLAKFCEAEDWNVTVIVDPAHDEQQAEAVVDDGAGSQAVTEPKEQKLSKLKKQQAAILEVIKDKELNPMAIPDGKKTNVIQKDCENKHATIFNGSTSFDRAWDLGLKSNLWRMEYHDSYARRGNN